MAEPDTDGEDVEVGGRAKALDQRDGATVAFHLHCLVLDGVYRCGADGSPAFIEADAPNDEEL